MNKLQKDVAERAFWTAVQTFLGVFIVADISTAKGALVAAAAAGLSVIKGFVATKVGDPESAAMIK